MKNSSKLSFTLLLAVLVISTSITICKGQGDSAVRMPIVIWGTDTGYKEIPFRDRVIGDTFIDSADCYRTREARVYICLKDKRWRNIEKLDLFQLPAQTKIITPEMYGAVQLYKTHAQLGRNMNQLINLFGDTIKTLNLNNLADEDALRMCAAKAKYGWTCTFLSPGTYYIENYGMVYPKGCNGRFQSLFLLQMNGAEIKVMGNKPLVVVGREDVGDIGEANLYVNNAIILSDGFITGNNKCLGFQPKYSYSSGLDNCFINNCLWAGKFEFSLFSVVQRGNYTNNKNGFDVGPYRTKGWTIANACSNSTSIDTRFYFADGDTAVKGDNVSGLTWSGICEGSALKYGMTFDAPNATTVREVTIRNIHFEVEQGAGSAFAKVRLREGTVIMDTFFGQYPATLLDAAGTTGIVSVVVKNIAYSVVPKLPARQFMNSGCSWTVENHHGLNTSNFQSFFGGTPVKLCPGLGAGLNCIQIINIPK